MNAEALLKFLEDHDVIFFLLGSIFLVGAFTGLVVLLDRFLPARAYTQHYQPKENDDE